MRTIEIFTSDCPLCQEAVEEIKNASCSSCDIQVLNIKDDQNAFAKSKTYGIKRVPSVVIDGKLAECCNNGINIEELKALGLGSPN